MTKPAKSKDVNARQVINDTRLVVMNMKPSPEVTALLENLQALTQAINGLQEAVIVSMEREAIAQSHRAIAEREIAKWKQAGTKKGRDYLISVIGRELDMDPKMVELVLRWMEGDAPAEVPPFHINQLRDALRELRDIVASERGIDE